MAGARIQAREEVRLINAEAARFCKTAIAATTLPSFPRKRESICSCVKLKKPRLTRTILMLAFRASWLFARAPQRSRGDDG
jgi:hypothetical protein